MAKGRTTRRKLGALERAIRKEQRLERELAGARARTASLLIELRARGTSSVYVAHALFSARGLQPSRSLLAATRAAIRKRVERARRAARDAALVAPSHREIVPDTDQR